MAQEIETFEGQPSSPPFPCSSMGVDDNQSVDQPQLMDIQKEIRELREFLCQQLSHQTEILENLQGSYAQMEPVEEHGHSVTHSPSEDDQENQDVVQGRRASIGVTFDTPGSGGRGSFVEASIFQLKAKARMQSLKSRASRQNPGRQGSEHWIRSFFEKIVNSRIFTMTITLLILLSVVLLGAEVDLYASLDLNKQVPGWFHTANVIIVAVFVVEMALKFIAFGCRNFWCSKDASWNILDFCIVFLSVLDLVLEMLSSSLDTRQLSLVRAIRIIRAVRGLRVLRMFRYITAFRTLALSVISTLGSLFWTLALLVMIFYFFSIVLTQLVADNCRFEKTMDSSNSTIGLACQQSVEKYFGSVPESMLTLFMTITNGISWEEAMRPLREVSTMAVLFLIAYIAIAVLAILNVVTGV